MFYYYTGNPIEFPMYVKKQKAAVSIPLSTDTAVLCLAILALSLFSYNTPLISCAKQYLL